MVDKSVSSTLATLLLLGLVLVLFTFGIFILQGTFSDNPNEGEKSQVDFSTSENNLLITPGEFEDPVNIFVDGKYAGQITSIQETFEFTPNASTGQREYSVQIYSSDNETLLQTYSYTVPYDETIITITGNSDSKRRTITDNIKPAEFTTSSSLENITYIHDLTVEGLGLEVVDQSVGVGSNGLFYESYEAKDGTIDYRDFREITVNSIKAPDFTFTYNPRQIQRIEGDKYYLADAESSSCDTYGNCQITGEFSYVTNNSGQEDISWYGEVFASGAGSTDGASVGFSTQSEYYYTNFRKGEPDIEEWRCCFGAGFTDDISPESDTDPVRWNEGEVWKGDVRVGSFDSNDGFGGAEIYIASKNISLVTTKEREFSLYKNLSSSNPELPFPINIPPSQTSTATTSKEVDSWTSDTRKFGVNTMKNIVDGTLEWSEYRPQTGSYNLKVNSSKDDDIANLSYSGSLVNSKSFSINKDITPTRTVKTYENGDLIGGTQLRLNFTTNIHSHDIEIEDTKNGNTYDVGNLKDGETETITIDSYIGKSNIVSSYFGADPKVEISYE